MAARQGNRPFLVKQVFNVISRLAKLQIALNVLFYFWFFIEGEYGA